MKYFIKSHSSTKNKKIPKKICYIIIVCIISCLLYISLLMVQQYEFIYTSISQTTSVLFSKQPSKEFTSKNQYSLKQEQHLLFHNFPIVNDILSGEVLKNYREYLTTSKFNDNILSQKDEILIQHLSSLSTIKQNPKKLQNSNNKKNLKKNATFPVWIFLFLLK